MNDAIEELKTRASLLLKGARAGESGPRARLQHHFALPVEEVRRKHSLDVLAREYGFTDFRHAHEVLEADGLVPDFGTLLYRDGLPGFLNHWFSAHQSARQHHQAQGGFLLPYRRQFFVAGASFVRALGLDPDDRAWEKMGHDWVFPRDPRSRRQLYAELIRQRQRERPA